MSRKKELEHLTFSNIVLARNIKLNKEQLDQVAIYFAFEDINHPKLETNYANKYQAGKNIVTDLINDFN